MTDSARIKLAALAVVLFLSGISAAGALNHTPTAPVSGGVPPTVSPQPAPALIPSPSSENND